MTNIDNYSPGYEDIIGRMPERTRKPDGRSPSVKEIKSPLAFREVSEEEIFVAENAGSRRNVLQAVRAKSDTEVEDAGESVEAVRKAKRWGTAVIDYAGPGRVTMYKQTHVGWEPRQVDTNALPTLLAEGWKRRCPDCGGHHGADPNDCDARPPVKFGRCPVCGTQIFDDYQVFPEALLALAKDVGDDNLLEFEEFGASTPESRVKTAIQTHMWAKHPRSSAERNIPQPVMPSFEVAAAGLAARRI